MGAAFYLSFEKSVPELDELGGIDGKSLAKNSDALAKAAERLGVRPLDSFAAEISEEELASTLGIDLDELADIIPEARKRRSPRTASDGWFRASAGLETATALLRDVRARPKHYDRSNSLIDELETVVSALRVAAKKKIRFRLKVDL
jgi:hypothetical protein